MDKKKISICYVISSLCEGPTNVLYNIVRYLDFNKFDVFIITLVPEKTTSIIKKFRCLPIRIIQLSQNQILNPISLGIKLRQVTKRISPDIIHVHCPRSRMLSIFFPKSCKKVETIHNYPDLPKVLYGKFKGMCVMYLSTFFTKKMDLVIPCSESIGKKYDEMGIKNVPILNGCSMEIWEYNEKEKLDLRRNLNMKDNIKYFLFIGRFSEEKNPDILIKAFEDLDNMPIGLVMLGSGRLYEEMKKHESDKIRMPGYIQNIRPYLIASDYFVSSSDSEGMPNSVLEGMATGLPLLLSDIAPHREIMNKTRDTIGFLYNQKDLNEVEYYIKKMLEINSDKTSAKIHGVFEKYFTAQVMSERYSTAYFNLLLNK